MEQHMNDFVIQDPKELEWFLDRLVANNVASILFLGVFNGGIEFNVARRYSSLGRSCHITGIDMEFRESLFKTHKTINELYPNITINYIKHNLHNQITDLMIGKHDLVFIDADHKYEAVKNDFQLSLRCARRFIAFHDIASSCDGSYRFWREEIKPKYNYCEKIEGILKEGKYTDPVSGAVQNDIMYGIGIMSLNLETIK